MPAAIIPAIIGAAGSIGGALLSKKAGVGGPSPQQNALTDLQMGNLKQASDESKTLFPYGTNLLDLSKSTFSAPLNYWTSLAGGSRTGALSTLAPQISQITESNAANTDALNKLFPRSGASPDMRAMSIYAPQKGVSSLLQTVRPEANKELPNIAGQIGSIGSYTSGTALQGLTGAANAGTSLNDLLLRQQINQQQQQTNLGKSIGDLLYTLTKGLKLGGGSTVTGTPPFDSGATSGLPFPWTK